MFEQNNLIMGIVNVTPDSFSDGNSTFTAQAAIDRVSRLIDDGADIIDVGAESTRPGSEGISIAEELQRLEPIFRAVAAERWPRILFSIDTQKPPVMCRAIEHGFKIVNNVSGLAPSETLEFIARHECAYVAMHMAGEPRTMQVEPMQAHQMASEIAAFFAQCTQRLIEAGFSHDRIWLDPGIGFGKTLAANLQALQLALKLHAQHNVVVGLSRKSFIGRMLNLPDPLQRDQATKMLELGMMLTGIKAIRTHDVATLVQIRRELQQGL